MKIDIFNDNILEDVLKNGDTFEFSNSISNEDILKYAKAILSYEEKDKEEFADAKISLKDLDSKKLTCIYKFWMSRENLEKIRNSTIILNIILLLKTYNTFDNDFFEHPLIFISSIDKYLDVKLDLQEEIQEINRQIGVYFMSMVKSLSKTEYTMLDSYVEMPYFFKSIFISMDLVTISGILSTIPEDYQYKTSFLKDANVYMTRLARNYVMSDDLMNEFLGKTNTEGVQ